MPQVAVATWDSKTITAQQQTSCQHHSDTIRVLNKRSSRGGACQFCTTIGIAIDTMSTPALTNKSCISLVTTTNGIAVDTMSTPVLTKKSCISFNLGGGGNRGWFKSPEGDLVPLRDTCTTDSSTSAVFAELLHHLLHQDPILDTPCFTSLLR